MRMIIFPISSSLLPSLSNAVALLSLTGDLPLTGDTVTWPWAAICSVWEAPSSLMVEDNASGGSIGFVQLRPTGLV